MDGNRLTGNILASIILIVVFMNMTFCKNPAPSGIHGEYSLNEYDTTYQLLVSKDSFFLFLQKKSIIVDYIDYNSPLDSARYNIENISCNMENIEAYIEFEDKKSKFHILWFSAKPCEEEDEYVKRAKEYYNCFELLLKNSNLIK